MKDIKIIAFDADDTLWVNEPYFREAELKFSQLMEDYAPGHTISKALYKTEIDNLRLYGYGIKGFMLSMIETALQVSQNTADLAVVQKSIEIGKELLEKPIELLDGVQEVLETLYGQYLLVVATKGDLLDQERKLKKSGLEHFFHHIEIMSDKQVSDYQRLVKRLGIAPEEFLMMGNSLKSDIMPVLQLGGYAVHIPYHTTWEHEKIDHHIYHPNFKTVASLKHILPYLQLI
jgi:putative hydrolase of the HAD superfamily